MCQLIVIWYNKSIFYMIQIAVLSSKSTYVILDFDLRQANLSS